MYWIHGITTLAIQDGLVRMLEPAVALKHKIGHKKVKVLAATQKISRKSESIENKDVKRKSTVGCICIYSQGREEYQLSSNTRRKLRKQYKGKMLKKMPKNRTWLPARNKKRKC